MLQIKITPKEKLHNKSFPQLWLDMQQIQQQERIECTILLRSEQF